MGNFLTLWSLECEMQRKYHQKGCVPVENSVSIAVFVSFSVGFNTVFPMEKLSAFSPEELQVMLSGEQVPQWTWDDIMNYTEPKFGYTRDAPGFQRFVNVLVSMNGDERKVWKSVFGVFCDFSTINVESLKKKLA